MPTFPKSIEKDSGNAIASRRGSPLPFFLLVFALSIPFWLIGAVTGLQLLPGIPVSSLMVLSPMTAALILVHGENKTAGVIELLKRSFDFPRIRVKVWYAPIVLLMPGVMVLSYGLMRLMGSPLPAPQFPILTALPRLRFTLRSAYRRLDHCIRGRKRYGHMGATNVGPVQKCLMN